MPMGKHYGAFAKGFSDSLIAMMRLAMTKDLYDARAEYYRGRGYAAMHPKDKGALDPGTQNAIDKERGAWGTGGGGGGGPPPNASDFDKFKYGLTGEEGKGSYTQLGPTVGGRGQAIGRYQIMPANVGPWTKQYLGKEMTPEEFRNSPEAQDKVFEGKIGDYYKQYGNWRDVASMWHSGVPYQQAVNEGRHDVNETTARYVDHVMANSRLGGTADPVGGTPDVPGGVYRQAGAGIKDPYANIPDVDDQGRPGQKAKFQQWNNDPVANSDKLLSTVHPDLQAVVRKAQADNPDLHFVVALGKSTPAQEKQAQDWGWGQGGTGGSHHLQGNVVDLWPVDSDGHINFDKSEQAKINKAVQKASSDLGVKTRWGGTQAEGGSNKSFRDAPNFELESPRPLAQAAKKPLRASDTTAQAAPTTSYRVAGEAGPVTEAGAERARADLEAHRVPSDGDASPESVAALKDEAARRADPRDQPPERERYPEPPTVSAQDRNQDPAQVIGAANQAAALAGKPDSLPPRVGRDWVEGDQPALPPVPTPGPVMGPPTRADTGARPDLTPRSGQMGPEGPGQTELPPEYSHMPSPGQVDPKGVYAPTSYARDTGARPDLTARSPATANQPSPAAQPVSATQAIPATAAQDPRFVQVDAPNQNPNARGQARQMTAIDLSHLWGPNPPVADRAPAPPGPPPPVAVRPQDQGFAVGAPDMGNEALGEQIMGSAKGGPITRRVSFAKGGAIPSKPTTAFYGGGSGVDPAPQAYAPTPTGAGASPAYTALRNEINTDAPGGGGPNNPNWASMTPAQQQWWQNASTALNQGYSMPSSEQNAVFNAVGAYPSSTPAAAAAPAPVAAPAPAPVITPPSVQNITTYQGTASDPSGVNAIDPTSTTTTGTPGVPNTVTAATYDPNKIATTGSGSAVNATGGTNYSTDTNDTTKQILSRKGGPIRRFAQGGGIPTRPTMRYDAAGVVAAMNSPSYVGPTLQGGWSGTPYAQLAPNQQTWANTEQGLLGQESTAAKQDAAYWSGGGQNPTGTNDTMQYWNQMSLMPNAIWPTTTPAAPTPLNEPAPSVTNITTTPTDVTQTDPTSTTTTGIPGVPTTGVQAATYDPNKIATTGSGSKTDSTGGTNYSTDPNDTTKQILSRKGGPITRRVSRYDDGGGVSPSFAGMPPGLGGGGQQAIPPIYYNPATYAGAGAPVGKGVSNTSAPTYVAGAIPSLPMARGGAVAFDDGGNVGIGGDADLNAMSMMDMQDARDDQGAAAAPTTPTSDKDEGWYIGPDQMGSAAPTAPTTPAAPLDHSTPPPDPTTPQIKDDQGNPSRGLIGAISDGLHWLGDHLGLAGSAQAGTLPPAIAHDPQTQDSRQKFVSNNPDGATYMTHQNVEELKNIADPGGQLNDAYRNIAALEAGYKFALSRGDDATAGRLAASMLHYSVLASQNLSDQAAKSLYKGDMKDAVDKMNQASDAVPDGRLVHATLNDDGTVTIQGKNLNGQVEWQKHGAAATILEHATALGRSGKLQWDSLESQAAKYDSTFAEMAKNRNTNATQDALDRRQTEREQHQQDVIDAREKAKTDAATAAQERIGKAFAPQTQAIPPASVTPRVTPVNAPPSSASDTTTASAALASPPAPTPASGGTPAVTPPPTSDENQGQGPTVANAAGLPSQPSRADIPTTDAQDVEAYQRRYNLVADQVIKQVGAEPQPPNQPDWSQLQPSDYPAARAQLAAAQKDYQDRHGAWETQVREGIAGEMKDISGERSDQATTNRMREQEKLQQTGAELAATRQREEQERTQTFTEQAPLTPIQRQDIYKGTSPMEVTASLPRNAVYKSDGTIDPVASAQALGKAYDLPPPGGGAATGGLQRATTVANVSEDAATYNTHMGVNDVHDLVDGLARGVYTIDGKPTPVTRHGEQLDQFTVHQQKGDPGVTLFLPKQSGYRIVQIRQDFENAKPKAAGALPPPPRTQSFPGVTPGAATQGGFNQPATPLGPRGQWWIDQALGRGQPAPPTFGQPGQQGARGYP